MSTNGTMNQKRNNHLSIHTYLHNKRPSFKRGWFYFMLVPYKKLMIFAIVFSWIIWISHIFLLYLY